jgi:nucleoporin SEH1
MWKVTWAHPQYGQVFASCAKSSELFIWEENIKRRPGTAHELIREWSKVASLNVTKNKIQDIKFSPEHCGLKLLVLYKNG